MTDAGDKLLAYEADPSWRVFLVETFSEDFADFDWSYLFGLEDLCEKCRYFVFHLELHIGVFDSYSIHFAKVFFPVKHNTKSVYDYRVYKLNWSLYWID